MNDSTHDVHNEACGCMPPPPEPVLANIAGTALAGVAERSIAPKPPELSRMEIGKLRRQYITRGPFETVNSCGHKFHPTNEPSGNCNDCWEAFFRVHEGVVIGIQSIIKTFGETQMVKVRGKKFMKRYKAYAAMVEEEQRAAATEAAMAALPAEVLACPAGVSASL